MKFAFADPPYLGQAWKHYARTEVDHYDLISQLVRDYPDGSVLCCSCPSLSYLLKIFGDIMGEPKAYCLRVGAWVKPFASFKPNVNPAYAWEPVLYWGGHKRSRTEPTVRDWVSASITLKKGLSGAKPAAFCDWVLDLLGTTDDDEWHDLFPGTGIFTERWKTRQGRQIEVDRNAGILP